MIGPTIFNELKLEEKTIAEYFSEAGYKTAHIGKWHLGNTGFLPLNQGFMYAKGASHKGSPPSYYYPYAKPNYALKEISVEFQDSIYLTDALTKLAIRYIQDKKDSSFFLFLPYFSVHIPLEPRPDLLKKYIEKKKLKGYLYFYQSPLFSYG